MIEYFRPQPSAAEIPDRFPSPFSNTPHPLAVRAAELLQRRSVLHSAVMQDFHATDGGKMFGVLVVRDAKGRYGFLSAFSGMLGGRWVVDGFAPPVFDSSAQARFWPEGEAELNTLNAAIDAVKLSPELARARQQLNTIVQQGEKTMARLVQQHQSDKAERQRLRAIATRGGDGQALQALSFASQRDKRARRELRRTLAEQSAAAEADVRAIEAEIDRLTRARQRRSRQLHKRLFDTYALASFRGTDDAVSLRQFFSPKMPPGGSGDCAGPKLLALAQRLSLQPLAMAEFWWGRTPPAEVRHHGRFYPACRGKCGPILPHMLQGIPTDDMPDFTASFGPEEPRTVYEDTGLVVIEKPAGMLSVPGKAMTDSVQSRLAARYPDAEQILPVHRLDMSTSGLLMVAKNRQTHKKIQAQFVNRQVDKRYVALLQGRITSDAGEIRLPIRTDFDDRPRQLVCREFGKPAITRWQLIREEGANSRVYFYPHTGRTHQLRVHASHHLGLNTPIVGDELYGQGDTAQRLCLHAERLGFWHPVTGRRLVLHSDVAF